jgi:hypothetical protein
MFSALTGKEAHIFALNKMTCGSIHKPVKQSHYRPGQAQKVEVPRI